MANHPDRIVVWPGYFDSKTSRRSGRRVSKDRSVANPTLDGLAYAARNAGIKKMKREEGVSHPARPSEKEGACGFQSRMHNLQPVQIPKKVSCKRLEVLGTVNNLKPRLPKKAAKVSGPKTGDKRGRSQRKSFKGVKVKKPSERRKRRK